ncbi:YopX family protein [Lentilactobacillus sp. G22-6]|uniref:YopX family protein n=1 Tax=Lentilactobacillus dabitei TaxID=2831523 RepID=UPI001C280F77|nr:YopX family protein [Lentilactobacillus dabitei]MBU9788572.1 YopX family protein [Lentilactobacillus dabitei]
MIPKFRAYIKYLDGLDYNDVPHKGHFVYGNLIKGNFNDNIDAIVGNLIEINGEYVNVEWWKCIQKGSAEQSTGLKDKNGKEIYEGDILAWHSNIYRKHDWVGLVLYRGAGFAVQESDKSYSSPEWLDSACRKDANIIEVIGNIHENPELLEVDK